MSNIKLPGLQILVLASLIALLAFGAWPAFVAGQEKLETEDAYAEWSTSLNKEKVIQGEQFYAVLDIVTTIKKLPGGAYEAIIEIVNRIPSHAVVSYDVIGRKDEGEEELLIGSYEISKSLPKIEEGARLEFLDEKLPSEGYLTFPEEAEPGRYALYVRFIEIEAEALFIHKDITGMIKDYFPPQLFGSGIRLAEIELVTPSPETRPPRVISISPADETDVPVETSISVEFNEPVDRASAEAAFSISPNIRGEFSWEEKVLTFIPDRKLSRGTSYKVNVGMGIRDLTGAPLADEFSWTFTTQSKPSLWWVWLIVVVVTLGLLAFSVVVIIRRISRRSGYRKRT